MSRADPFEAQTPLTAAPYADQPDAAPLDALKRAAVLALSAGLGWVFAGWPGALLGLVAAMAGISAVSARLRKTDRRPAG